MDQKEKDDLKKAGKLLDNAAELAGEAVMLLGLTGRMAEVGQAEVAMCEFGNIARKIGCILEAVVEGEKRGE